MKCLKVIAAKLLLVISENKTCNIVFVLWTALQSKTGNVILVNYERWLKIHDLQTINWAILTIHVKI